MAMVAIRTDLGITGGAAASVGSGRSGTAGVGTPQA
jgi:hypothetical protein